MVREHRRVAAVDLDANAVRARGREDRWQERAVLLVRAAQLAVGARTASARLEPQQLDLRESALGGVREDAIELGEVQHLERP